MTRFTLALLAAALAGGPAVAQISTSVLAASGDSAPGGGTYTVFGRQGPSLNASGQVAFLAGLSGNSSGVFRFTNGTSELIARQGQAAPEVDDTYSGFRLAADGDRASLRADGDLVFSASLSGSGLDGLFRSVGGTASLATLTEVPAVGLSGVTVTTLYPGSARLTAGNRVFTYVDLSDVPDQAIYEANGSALTLVAAGGMPAPGGGTFIEIPTEFTVNAVGQLAFASNLSGGGGVFRYQSGVGTVAIARTGTVAPGGAGTVSTVEFSVPAVNAAGQVAFVAGLTGSTSTAGVFRGTDSALTAIALEGRVAPDTGGRRFNRFDLFQFPDAVRGNANGEVLFLAGLTGESFGNSGLFRGNGTGLALIAQRGEVAPGTAGVARFASFTASGGPAVGLTDGGQVVFRASVEGVGVTANNDTGLWTGTGFGDLQLIAREGDQLTVNGQSRTLAGLLGTFEVNSDGVAWQAVFTDGTEAIVFTRYAVVPEPSGLLAAAAAVAVGGLAVGRRKRFRTG